MCGIVAVVPDYDSRPDEVLDGQLSQVLPEVPRPDGADGDVSNELNETLDSFVRGLADAVESFSTPTACHRLAADSALRRAVTEQLSALERWRAGIDEVLDSASAQLDADTLEHKQRQALRARDLLWTIWHDRVAAASRVGDLARGTLRALDAARTYFAVDAVLSAVERLEVRGRDSAGIQIWVTLAESDLQRLPGSLRLRADADFRHRAVSFFRGGLAMVYKRASIIGRLGDNVAALREAITADDELYAVLAMPSARVTVMAHTRRSLSTSSN